jgi:peptidoglycan/xylan/chitin deacetylase (PgdA/CDA1 family)
MPTPSNPRALFKMSTEHAKLAPLAGKRLIVHVIVNIEYWPYDQPTPRTIVVPPHGKHSVPDLPNFCWSEYGNRCGMPRFLKLFGDRNLPVSASINASVIDVYPTLAAAVRDAGWEFVGHGIHQRGLGVESDEVTLIRSAVDKLEAYTGKRTRGWMSPGWSETFNTLDHLRSVGIEYVCQWVIDDIPTRLTTKHGDMVSIPYGLDLNDSVIYAIEKHSSPEMKLRFDEAVKTFERETRETGQPRVLTIPLHPHLSGVAHRINFLTELIDELRDRSDTIFVNGSQLTDWYLSHNSKS